MEEDGDMVVIIVGEGNKQLSSKPKKTKSEVEDEVPEQEFNDEMDTQRLLDILQGTDLQVKREPEDSETGEPESEDIEMEEPEYLESDGWDDDGELDNNKLDKKVIKKAISNKSTSKGSTSKKSTSKKSTSKKSTSKKSTSKKSTSKKSTSKKSTSKKSTSKNSASKKSTSKKSIARKSITKKSITKKLINKKSITKKLINNKSITNKSKSTKSPGLTDHEEDNVHRYTLRPPTECKSFVHELRQKYPELKNDTKLLILTLAEIMRSLKPPPLPRDYFIMTGVSFECVKCGKLLSTEPAASRHWQERHGPRYLVCYACGVDFRSTTNLYKHEKRCRGKDALIVLKARARIVGVKGRGRPFMLPPGQQGSLKPVKPRIEWVCPHSSCNARYNSKVGMEAHAHVHNGERPFQCGFCKNAYTSKSALKRHQSKHTGVRFECDDCGRAFRLKTALVTHMDTHLPQRRFLCDICDKRFAQKSALQLHVDRVHRGLPPPCACQLCPRRYPRMSLLKKHMQREHGMNLITRKMFFKMLPTLSETRLEQAKIVLKSEHEAVAFNEETYIPIPMAPKHKNKTKKNKTEKNNQTLNTIKVEIECEETQNECNVNKFLLADEEYSDPSNDYVDNEYIIPDQNEGANYIEIIDDNAEGKENIALEVLQYLQQIQDQGINQKDVSVIYVQDGQVVQVVDK